MSVGQIITLGVGTPSSIALLDLTGLSPSVVPGGSTGSVPIGPATDLIANFVYALPARSVNIDWQSTGAANLDVSLDGSSWVTIDSTLVAGYKTVQVTAIFIRPSANITVILRKARPKL